MPSAEVKKDSGLEHVRARIEEIGWAGNLLLGVFLSGLLVGIAHDLAIEALGGTISLSPYQVAIQIGLALFMFGYYLGLSIRERSAIAEILTGFIIGALIFPTVLFGFSGTIDPTAELIIVCAIPAGLLLALQKAVFERERLSASVKFLINAGLWSGQAAATSSAIPIIAQTGGFAQAGIFLAGLMVLGIINRNAIRLVFGIVINEDSY